MLRRVTYYGKNTLSGEGRSPSPGHLVQVHADGALLVGVALAILLWGVSTHVFALIEVVFLFVSIWAIWSSFQFGRFDFWFGLGHDRFTSAVQLLRRGHESSDHTNSDAARSLPTPPRTPEPHLPLQLHVSNNSTDSLHLLTAMT